jgi:hypothetical protein
VPAPPLPETTTPILPTRVVPSLLSPSFDEVSPVDLSSVAVRPADADDKIVSTAVLSQPPKVYSSVVFPVNL